MNAAIQREVRRSKRERELGDNPTCALCGYRHPYGLLKITRSVFEKHHAVGWQNDWGLTVVLCRNCHWEQTETLRDEGIVMSKSNTFQEQLVTILNCVKVLLLSLAEACGRWAIRLAESITAEPKQCE